MAELTGNRAAEDAASGPGNGVGASRGDRFGSSNFREHPLRSDQSTPLRSEEPVYRSSAFSASVAQLGLAPRRSPGSGTSQAISPAARWSTRSAVTRAAATAGRQRWVISLGAEAAPARRGSFSDPPGRAAARRTARRTAPACRVAGNHMPVRCVAVVRGGGGACLVSGGQDNVRMPGRAVERGHVCCPAGEAGALVDVALVGYLARIQLRGVAEQHQPLDPP
jgi:hypothetical protein